MGGKIDKLLCHALKLYFLLEYHMFTIGRRMEAPCNFQGKKTKTKQKKTNTLSHYLRTMLLYIWQDSHTWTDVDESFKSWTRGPITVSQDNRPPLSTWRLNISIQYLG
jgi:hypothetical protein